ALGLAAFHAFRVAAARGSFLWALLSGLLAGLGAQTKYTGFVTPLLLLLYAFFTRRLRLWPASAVAAVAVFVAWEAYTARLYGRSHFLVALSGSAGGPLDKVTNFPFLFSFLGGLLPAFFCLGLAALGVRRPWVLAAAGAVLGGYLAVAVMDSNFVNRSSP